MRLLRPAIINPSMPRRLFPVHHPSRCYLLFPEPQDSITLLVEISRSHGISLPFLLLGMLTAFEFDNQLLLAASRSQLSKHHAGAAGEFESREALGSEMFPELALLVGGLGTKPPAAITRGFPVRDHNRPPQKAG